MGLFDDDPALGGKRDEDPPRTPFNESGYCKFCGKPLLWVSTHGGARMPLDRDYEERWITESGTQPMKARKRRTYTCHLDTCPKKGGR